jgi:hypothetical protein
MNKAKSNKNKKNAKQNKRIPVYVSITINIAVAMLFLVLIYKVSETVPPYKWLKDKFLKGNLSFIDKYPLIDKKDKLANKLKTSYNYCNFLVTYTPESAVILFPFDTLQFKQKDFKLKGYNQIKGRIMNKLFVSYFIYPRKMILISEIQKKEKTIDNITHLAIIDKQGYKYLPNYKDTTQVNTVLKVKKTIN